MCVYNSIGDALRRQFAFPDAIITDCKPFDKSVCLLHTFQDATLFNFRAFLILNLIELSPHKMHVKLELISAISVVGIVIRNTTH